MKRAGLYLGTVVGLVAGAALMLLTVGGVTASAAEPKMPGQPDIKFQRWWYPSQIPNGPIENGDLAPLPGSGPGTGFLTLPFTGPHYVTSIFDHCGPNYVPDGVVCRYDGLRREAGGFDEEGPPTRAWLFYDGHDGLDYGLYYEPVLASADGVVKYAGFDRPGCATCGFGQEVRIDHGNGITTRYAHLSTLRVGVGQAVRRGQVIGISGNSGASTGEHLHWGVYLTAGFVAVDPYGWTGAGPDPWSRDVGNLWLDGAPRFPAVSLPAVTLSVRPRLGGSDAGSGSGSEPGGGPGVASGGGEFLVDWKGGPGVTYDVQVVEDGHMARAWLSGVGAGTATFSGARLGHSYWFLVTESNDLGWRTTAASDVVKVSRNGGDGPNS